MKVKSGTEEHTICSHLQAKFLPISDWVWVWEHLKIQNLVKFVVSYPKRVTWCTDQREIWCERAEWWLALQCQISPGLVQGCSMGHQNCF